MTPWALIIMSCVRTCIPQYIEVYPSQEACVAAGGKLRPGGWMVDEKVCAPVLVNKTNPK